jgi:predicted dehydrogenase
MIGLGKKWSRQLAAAIGRIDTIHVVTCYARTPETRQSFASEYSCQDAPTLEAALTAPDVEAAIIAAPAHVHAEITHACVEQGIHVFVEKPMALTIEEARGMAEACDKAGLTLMVGHEMRRLGSSRAMKHIIDEGRLGRIVAATASLTLAGTFQPDNWRCRRDTNRGGALMQLGIHQIETLTYLLGPVVNVQGFFANSISPNGVDDVGIAHLTFENGMLATVSATYVSPKAYAMHIYGTHANLDCVADMRIWPDALQVDAATVLKLEAPDGREDIGIEPQDCVALQLDEFARSVRGDVKPETGAAEGVAAVAIVEAALRSFESGLSVDPRTL